MLSQYNMHMDIKSLRSCDEYTDGLLQDYSNSIANALELPLSCSQPSIYLFMYQRTDSYRML